jgi:hypothetical protein
MQVQLFRASRMHLIVYTALAIAGLSTAVGFGLRQRWLEMAASLSFTVLALFSETTAWSDRLAGLVFAGYAVLGGFGLLLGIPPLFGLLTLAAALIAWDLHHYRQRLAGVARIEGEFALVRRHLRRLFITVGAGVGLGGLALLVQVDYGVGVIVVLGLILAFGLSRAVGYLRKESD